MADEILAFFVSFTALSAVLAIIFYVWERRLKDLRTLRLGRLNLLFLFCLLFAVNGLTAIILLWGPKELQTGGLVVLFIEVILMIVLPMIWSVVIPVTIIVLTVQMWRRETRNFANLLLPAVVLFFLVVDFVYLAIGRLPESWMWLRVLSFVYPTLAIYLAWQFFVFFASSWVYGRRVKSFEATYYVVHGAGLIDGQRVSRLLANRIKAAVVESTEETILVMSGGKGDDERLSEAEAMRRYAVEELHFPLERIVLEDQSTTTYENLVNSGQLFGKRFKFFTSDFHVFRTALFAASLGLDAQGGKGGKTAFYYRVPAFIREFIAVMNSQRKKHMVWVSVIVVFFLLAAAVSAWLYWR